MAKVDEIKDQKLIPQDIDAEEALLGAILTNPKVLNKIVDSLTPQSFYKIAHKHVYEAMLSLYNNGQNIDIVTVSDVLNLNNKLEIVGGRAFINDLAFKSITSSNIEYYAKIIQEKAIKRALINAGAEIVSEGYNVNPTEESLDVAEKLIFDIASKKATKDMQHVKDIVLKTYESMEYRAMHKGELTGCPTGFRDLDAITNGLQPSDLIILAARPSMGKTAFALNIAQNAAVRNGVSVAIFSLEMSKEQLVQRLLCSEAEVDNNKIKTGNIPRKDWDKLNTAMEDLANSNIYIDETSTTLVDIRAKCRRLAMEDDNLGLIVIDYLQLMEGSAKDDRLQQVSKISRGLKGLAKDLNVPIIALSQLSRAVEQRKEKYPMLSDLRESGSIEQDADVVLFIHREDYYTDREGGGEEPDVAKQTGNEGKATIIIAKHRNGEIGKIELVFQGNIVKFKNTINTEIF